MGKHERTRKILAGLFIAFVAGTILLYSYGRAQAFLFGPEITIETPLDGASPAEDFVTVSGRVQNAARIYLNGTPIYTNDEGYFEEKLLLLYGYNILEVRAEDRFGQVEREVLHLTYQ